MNDHDRLSYYKRLKADGIALSGAQATDYQRIVNERGEGSAEPMPKGGIKYEIARQNL